MSKVFQILNNKCHWDASKLYSSAEEAGKNYTPDIKFIEAPDYVFEGWGYDETAEGDPLFIEPPPPTEPVDFRTPAQKREDAYNTGGTVEWGDKKISVTEAARLWQYYAAEGNEKADELQALISAAKAEIRERYPDENTEDTTELYEGD